MVETEIMVLMDLLDETLIEFQGLPDPGKMELIECDDEHCRVRVPRVRDWLEWHEEDEGVVRLRSGFGEEITSTMNIKCPVGKEVVGLDIESMPDGTNDLDFQFGEP